MIGFSILKELFDNILQTKFVPNVYHSVMLKQIENGSGVKPAAPVNGRYEYVGLDDTNGFSCYCRQNGPAEVIEAEKIGSCGMKKYRFKVPQRLVFFNENENRNHEDIQAKCLKAVMKTNMVTLQKLVTTPEEILRSESPTGRFKLKANSLYFAIEFFVLLDLLADNCESEIRCDGIDNPYCGPTTQQG